MTSTTNTAPLSDSAWAALEAAERRLYAGQMGCNGWTDVNNNEGDVLLRAVWDYAAIGVEVVEGAAYEVEIAARVAVALAALAFGPDVVDSSRLSAAAVREIADGIQLARGELGEAAMKDGEAQASAIERTDAILAAANDRAIDVLSDPSDLDDDPEWETVEAFGPEAAACAEGARNISRAMGTTGATHEIQPAGASAPTSSATVRRVQAEPELVEAFGPHAGPILAVLDDERDRLQRRVEAADADVLALAVEVDRKVVRVRSAVESGLRVEASVSGGSFYEDAAVKLARAIDARQRAHDDLASIEGLIRVARSAS